MTDHNPQLVAKLDALEAELPKMMADSPEEGDFWSAFAGEADAILDAVHGEEASYARGRIDCMLKNQGLIPGEDEGEPCK